MFFVYFIGGNFTGGFMRNEITVALGGGGVKGYSHLGVLRYLDKCGIHIHSIAGTSAGGLFGAVYAAGYRIDEMERMVARIEHGKLYNRLPGDGPSLLGLGGVIDLLEEMLGDLTFDDLKIPMSMTAVDLETGERIILNQGRLIDAVLATIALPGIFPPRQWEGRLVVDGGVVDPVPVSIARRMTPGLPVVAVVLTPPMRAWNGHRQPPNFLSSFPLINRLYQMRLAQSFNIFLRSVDIATCILTDMRLELERPDVIIRPSLKNIGLVEAVDILELIDLGERAAEIASPQLQSLWTRKKRFSTRWPILGDFFRRTSFGP